MIKLLSLFSGIGAFEKALDRIGAEYELVNYCEIDKYASTSYAAVHGVSEELNLRDVQTIDCDKLKEKGVNLVTYGFPCQDISIAGNMKGFEHKGQKTRSGLFYDALKVIRELQPEVAIAENVKALTGKKFEAEFVAVRGGLAETGYNNYYAVLNASDYGIPQHRERVFIVSIRKDVDRDKFAFPQKEPLRLRVKDLLEYDVDEKYYIDTDRARELIQKLMKEGKLLEGEPDMQITLKQIGEIGSHQTDRVYDPDGLSRSLKSTDYTHPVNIINTKIERLGNMYETTPESGQSDGDVFGINGISSALTCNHPFKIVEVKQIENLYPEAKFNNTQRGRVYDPEGCCPTINTMQGGSLEPKILEVVNVRDGNFIGVMEKTNTRCEAVGDLKAGGQRGRVYDAEKSMCALTATQYKDPCKILYNHRIRKLTPKECWRLMGFDDEDFEKAKAAGISNTQLYKQAGNSIVVQVLEKLFEKLLEAQKFEVEVK